MSIIQISLLVLIVSFFVKTVRISKDESAVPSRLVWTIFWVAAAAVVVRPDMLSRLADFVGVGRGVDLALYVIILVLVYMMFRMWVRLYMMESHITTLVRHIALDGETKDQSS